MVMRAFVLTTVLTCVATPAIATTCETSFQKKGDFLNGSAFSARVQVEPLTVEQAFAQLRPILAREGIKTVSTDVASGVMKAENPATAFQRALPIDVFAVATGPKLEVEMVFTLPSGVTARRETVKGYLCGALNQLKPTAAAPTATAPTLDLTKAIAIAAPDLASQVAAAGDNPARIRLNFAGKVFQVSGEVLAIEDTQGTYTVVLSGSQTPVTAGAPKASVPPRAVRCIMAKNQDEAVAALQPKQQATLVGQFQEFDRQNQVSVLSGCLGR